MGVHVVYVKKIKNKTDSAWLASVSSEGGYVSDEEKEEEEV